MALRNPSPVRDKLAPYEGRRVTATGIYDGPGHRVSGRHNDRIETALLKGVEVDGVWVADHLHVQFAESINNAEPARGELVRFSAVVKSYTKKVAPTYERVVDWTFFHPTCVELLQTRRTLPGLLTPEEEQMSALPPPPSLFGNPADFPAHPPEEATTVTTTLPASEQFVIDKDNNQVARRDGKEYITCEEAVRRHGGGDKSWVRVMAANAGLEPAFEYQTKWRGRPAGYYDAEALMDTIRDYRPLKKETRVESPSVNGVAAAPPVSAPKPPAPSHPPHPPGGSKAALVAELQRLIDTYGWESVNKAAAFLADT